MALLPRRCSFVAILLFSTALLSSGCVAVETVEGNTITYTQSPIAAAGCGVLAVGMLIVAAVVAWGALPDLMEKRKRRRGETLADSPQWDAFRQMLFSLTLAAVAVMMSVFLIPQMLSSSVKLEADQIVLTKGSLFSGTKVTSHRYDSTTRLEIEERRSRGRRGVPRIDKYLHVVSASGSEEIAMNVTHEAALPKWQERVNAAIAQRPQQAPAIAQNAGAPPAQSPLDRAIADMNANRQPARDNLDQAKNIPQPQSQPAGPAATTPASPQMPARPGPLANNPMGNNPARNNSAGMPRPSIDVRTGRPFLDPVPAGAAPKATAQNNSPPPKSEVASVGRFKPGAMVMITDTVVGTGPAQIQKVFSDHSLVIRFAANPQKDVDYWIRSATLMPPKKSLKKSAAPGGRLMPKENYPQGTKILARWGGDWYPATLIMKNKAQRCAIVWDEENTQMMMNAADCCLVKDADDSFASVDQDDRDEPEMKSDESDADEPNSSAKESTIADDDKASGEKFRKGDKIEASLASAWYSAVIEEVMPGGKYRIRYTNDNFKTVVSANRIRRPEKPGADNR